MSSLRELDAAGLLKALTNLFAANMEEYRRYKANRRKFYEKPRQEISHCLKYLIFVVNFAFLLGSLVCLLLGGYVVWRNPRPIGEPVDVVLNPFLLLLAAGAVGVFISLTACIGALRENICLLKSFTLFVFLCYIFLIVVTFLVFILFYTDTPDGVSIHSLLLKAVRDYDVNENMRELVDAVQEQLNCCGATSQSQGYLDWKMSTRFNCSETNANPEKCGVPRSCCKLPGDPGALVAAADAAKSAADNLNAVEARLYLPALHSLRCWQNAQKKELHELDTLIYTRGCLDPLQKAFEGNAVIIGAFVGGLILPVCVIVTLVNIFAKQIERQRHLLEREEKRAERRRRRAVEQYQQQQQQLQQRGGHNSVAATATETSATPQQQQETTKKAQANNANNTSGRQRKRVAKKTTEEKQQQPNEKEEPIVRVRPTSLSPPAAAAAKTDEKRRTRRRSLAVAKSSREQVTQWLSRHDFSTSPSLDVCTDDKGGTKPPAV